MNVPNKKLPGKNNSSSNQGNIPQLGNYYDMDGHTRDTDGHIMDTDEYDIISPTPTPRKTPDNRPSVNNRPAVNKSTPRPINTISEDCRYNGKCN